MPRDDAQSIAGAHAALVDAGVIEPLAEDPDETRRWLDCELASLVENRFFTLVDPLALGAEERARWEPRASSDEPLSSPHQHAYYRRAYWMREGRERAGTIALGTMFMGERLVTVSSLYTLPSYRRRGLAARVLRRAEDAVVAHGGAGLRVPTYWTWQGAIRFYLGIGMWLLDWRNAPVFGWRDAIPAHRIEIGEREARFGVVEGGAVTPFVEAARAGERLAWRELPGLAASGSRVAMHARQTFAIALATHGFPLIRAGESGWPEDLAHRIVQWEACEQENGYAVQTPRIPGLGHRER